MKQPIFLPQAFQLCLFHVLLAFVVSHPEPRLANLSIMSNPTLRSPDQKWPTLSRFQEFEALVNNQNAKTPTDSSNELSDLAKQDSDTPDNKPPESEKPNSDISDNKPPESEKPSMDSGNSGSKADANDSTESTDEKDTNVGVIAGGVVGGVAALLVIAVAVRFAVRRRIVEDIPEIDIQDNWNGTPSYIDAAVAQRLSRERKIAQNSPIYT